MATKEKVKQGNHLTVTTATDGTVSLKWDWDALLKEVQAATGGKVKATKPTSKKDLVKETETKVTKTRARKTTATKKSAK